MLKRWKLFETSNDGYSYVSKMYPSLYVTINPWNKSNRDSLYISVRAEESVIADIMVEDMDLLHDESALQDLLDDVEDISSKFMDSFENLLSWYDKYGREQATLFLIINDNDKDVRTVKREYKSMQKKLYDLFY